MRIDSGYGPTSIQESLINELSRIRKTAVTTELPHADEQAAFGKLLAN